MKNLFISILLLLLLVSCGGPDNGGELTDGISSTEHRIFITSTTTKGDMSSGTGADGLAKADDICNTTAKAADLQLTYKAVLGTSDFSALNRIIITGAIYVLAGSDATKIADSSTQFWGTSVSDFLLNPINRDENGTYLTNGEVWTGSSSDGTFTGDDCNKWTDATTSYQGDYGDYDKIDDNFISAGLPKNCNDIKHLYCISQQ